MKKIWFYLFFLIFILFPFSIFAGHACNQGCNGAANITCNETTGILSYNQGSCNAGLACYSGAGNVCRNPYCPTDTDCNCSTFTIQGYKQPNQSLFSGQTISLDGGSPTTAQPYFFSNVVANTIHRVSASSPPGSSVGYTLCYNNTNCHSNTPTSGSSVYICTNNPGTTNYADLWWHYTPLIPNCKNIKVNNSNLPYTVLAGDTITLTADYENLNGPVTSVGMVVNPQGSCSFSPLNVTQSAGAGAYSFNWTPTNAGNYDVFCRAWNDAVAECRGMCVDNPPRYQCPGSDGNGATSYGRIIVQNPGPWYKLKDASLNKIGNHDIAVVQNIKKFTDSDPDDDNNPGTGRYVIINSSTPSTSNPGILLATNIYNPGPSYNPIPNSTKGWHIGSYGNISQPMLDNFYQYIISRKSAKEINNLNEINADGIYIIKSDGLNISNPNFNFVLIVRNSNNTDLGNANITVNSFNSSNKSIMILAKKITFSSSVTTASGIFIAQTIEYQSTNGLKVLGNLISKTAVTLQSRSDNTRPSLFIVFKPKMYLDLLPYLSVSKYDWQQLQ
jgi:hypothetical protein